MTASPPDSNRNRSLGQGCGDFKRQPSTMIGALYEQVDQVHLLIAQIGTIVVSGAIIWFALTEIRLCRFWWAFVTVGALLTAASAFFTYNPTPSLSATGFPFILIASETIAGKQFGALLMPFFPLSLLANIALCFRGLHQSSWAASMWSQRHAERTSLNQARQRIRTSRSGCNLHPSWTGSPTWVVGQ